MHSPLSSRTVAVSAGHVSNSRVGPLVPPRPMVPLLAPPSRHDLHRLPNPIARTQPRPLRVPVARSAGHGNLDLQTACTSESPRLRTPVKGPAAPRPSARAQCAAAQRRAECAQAAYRAVPYRTRSGSGSAHRRDCSESQEPGPVCAPGAREAH